ncbi:MAG: hypothetical protein QM296_01015 [Bacillota bacterium]|nr:hypothetical protein [Bacillota bacterium]
MAFLVKKKINDNEYYYIIENRREGDKVVRAMEKYIGRVDEVVARLASGGIEADPVHSEVYSHAADLAFYQLAEKLGIVEALSGLSGTGQQGLSTGVAFVLTAVKQILDPFCESSLADWYAQSSLSRVLDVGENELDECRVQELMELWDVDKTRAFQDSYVRILRERHGIKPGSVIFDEIHFFVYVDTVESGDAQTRHIGRSFRNLGIIELSLLVDGETGLPLFFESGSCDGADSTLYARVKERLEARYRDLLGEETEPVMVFDDAGYADEDFIPLDQWVEEDEDELPDDEDEDEEELPVVASGVHFVAALKPGEFKEQAAWPLAGFQPCRHPRLAAYRCLQDKRVLDGSERNIVVCYSENLAEEQLAGIKANLDAALDCLMEEQERLRKWREGVSRKVKKPTRESVKKKLRGWLSQGYLGQLIEIVWDDDDENGLPFFSANVLDEGLEKLKENVLGRTVLISSQMDWTAEQVMLAWCTSRETRNGLRRVETPKHAGARSTCLGTARTIDAQILVRVLTHALPALLRLELERAGFALSREQMIRELEDIRLVCSYYQVGKKRNVPQLRTVVSLTKTSRQQDELLKALDLTDILAFR